MWDFYYIRRSSLNPHGTYAIVHREDMAVDERARHHIAEISGWGDGSPSHRKTPDTVHLIVAAPSMRSALVAQRTYILHWLDDLAGNLKPTVGSLREALASVEAAIAEGRGA